MVLVRSLHTIIMGMNIMNWELLNIHNFPFFFQFIVIFTTLQKAWKHTKKQHSQLEENYKRNTPQGYKEVEKVGTPASPPTDRVSTKEKTCALNFRSWRRLYE
ncbi:hypothetical protein XENORESO_004205 [Xenotaenia resolanae]|uniref:Uncharacterized protein n=1 Tax=Xenotaenia resolanae TaxID=208358 RepID=A0ABV0WIG1_9TELE